MTGEGLNWLERPIVRTGAQWKVLSRAFPISAAGNGRELVLMLMTGHFGWLPTSRVKARLCID